MPPVSDYLSQQNVDYFYHFTDVQNMKSIFDTKKLLSIKEIEERSLTKKTGGDEVSLRLAKLRGLDDYISLSFTPYTPMAVNRKQDHHLCFLKFRNEIADLPGVLFCNGNANANHTNREKGLGGAKKINLAAIKNGVQPSSGIWHDAARSEILIPTELSLCYLDTIIFVNGTSLQQTEELNLTDQSYTTIVDPIAFFDDPTVNADISFSVIESVILEGGNMVNGLYIVDRLVSSSLKLHIGIKAVGKIRLVVNSSCKTFNNLKEGVFSGSMSEIIEYSIKDMTNSHYNFNVWLNKSFWCRKVVIVN